MSKVCFRLFYILNRKHGLIDRSPIEIEKNLFSEKLYLFYLFKLAWAHRWRHRADGQRARADRGSTTRDEQQKHEQCGSIVQLHVDQRVHVRSVARVPGGAVRPRSRVLAMRGGARRSVAARVRAPPAAARLRRSERAAAPRDDQSHLHLVRGGRQLAREDASAASERE